MSPRNFYDTLGVPKSASEADIKKAYKKLAMQYHPDRNKGDKKAETKFKEINEAYQTLSDPTKKKNYDQFGSADFQSPFSGGGGGFSGFGGSAKQSEFSGFEDIFSQFGKGGGSQGGFEFDLGDILSSMGKSRTTTSRGTSSQHREEKNASSRENIANLDVTETVEIPFFDFLSNTSLSIRTVYGKNLSLKIKAGTKPGTKFKIKGEGRSIDGKTGDMYVIVEAKMPKMPLDPKVDRMIDAIRYEL